MDEPGAPPVRRARATVSPNVIRLPPQRTRRRAPRPHADPAQDAAPEAPRSRVSAWVAAGAAAFLLLLVGLR